MDNPETPVAKTTSTKRKVFLATTREASEVVEVFFTSERAPDLGLASVVVSIPPNHVPGQIERPKRLPPDPTTEFAVVEPTVYKSENSFISEINRELAKKPPKDRNLMLFVHGYNNTASDSILRIAQFVEDTGFNGVPVLFSWASAAKVSHYVYDLNSALAARPLLLEASGILQRTNAQGFDVFAHSMGGMLMLEAIVHAELSGKYNIGGRLGNVMLASPDIDLDVFESQLASLDPKERNFTIFVANDDKALKFSRWISGGVPRVGAAHTEALAELGVTVIDLSQVDDSSSGTHSKFAGSPEVVQVIGNSLKADNYQSGKSQLVLLEILGSSAVLTVLQ
ncbi:alpha/beta hydrolase (plasmid) [Aliisedimentitalea scapharcae]|uniref:Alpha/beta hydrolase n=1 Tax=Aliisedimentitalea scapharcae TaxID=1524259 RepID=A0ABZ2Y2M2_9RHOB